MTYRVTVAAAAEHDMFEIVEYTLARERELEPGLRVLERLERRIASLSSNAHRGRRPPELRRIGLEEYRELIAAPWRILYSLREAQVHVVAVLDLRRDAADLLRERALRFARDQE